MKQSYLAAVGIAVFSLAVVRAAPARAQVAQASGVLQPNHCATCYPLCEHAAWLITPDPDNGWVYWTSGQFCSTAANCPYFCSAFLNSPTPAQTAALLESAAKQNDVRTIEGILARNKFTTISVSRSAIQIRSCSGVGVIAHIPISTQTLAAIIVDDATLAMGPVGSPTQTAAIAKRLSE